VGYGGSVWGGYAVGDAGVEIVVWGVD
jgi:hypothetical protein